MGKKKSSLKNCFTAEVISGDGTFNLGLCKLAKGVKLPADGSRYTVVSIVGPQSSGKSTLMNKCFGTEFKEMYSEGPRKQTTKGIWVTEKKLAKGGILVIDTEGTDAEEREDDASFERQTVAFVLAMSNTVIFNIMCSDIGRRSGGCLPLIETLFEVKIQKFSITHKVSLEFVLRDKTKNPSDILRKQLMQQLEKIWRKMRMPQDQTKLDLKDHFNIEVTTMSGYETHETQFKEEAAKLGVRIINSSTSSEYGLGCGSASEFIESASRLWDDIKNDKDLDLPSYSIMLAERRCSQISDEKYKTFLKDESWLQIQKDVSSGNMQQFGMKVNKLIATYLSKYDKETLKYAEEARDQRREKLVEELLRVIKPRYVSVLQHIRAATLENFEKADYIDYWLSKLDSQFADAKIDHADWNLDKELRSKFEQDIKNHQDRVPEIKSEFEFDPLKKKQRKSGSNWSDLLWQAINSLIKLLRDDPSIRSLFFPVGKTPTGRKLCDFVSSTVLSLFAYLAKSRVILV